jgi:hypothetical protein
MRQRADIALKDPFAFLTKRNALLAEKVALGTPLLTVASSLSVQPDVASRHTLRVLSPTDPAFTAQLQLRQADPSWPATVALLDAPRSPLRDSPLKAAPRAASPVAPTQPAPAAAAKPSPAAPTQPAPAAAAKLVFSVNPFDTISYGNLVALESPDGWFLSVHPKSGLVSVREPEPRWVERARLPFDGGARPPPIYAFRVAHLTDPHRKGAVRFGDAIWLVVVSGGGRGGAAAGVAADAAAAAAAPPPPLQDAAGARAPPPAWQDGSVLCAMVQRGEAMGAVSPAVAAAALGGWDEAAGRPRATGAAPSARAAAGCPPPCAIGSAPSELAALRAYLEVRESHTRSSPAARATARGTFSPLDPADMLPSARAQGRPLAAMMAEAQAGAARARARLLDECGERMGVLRPGVAFVPPARVERGDAAAAEAAAARNRLPAALGRWALVAAEQGGNAPGSEVRNGAVVVLTQGFLYVTSAPRVGAAARGAQGGGGGGAGGEAEGAGGDGDGGGGRDVPPAATSPSRRLPNTHLSTARAAADSSVFEAQPGDGYAGGNRREVFLAAGAVDLGTGEGGDAVGARAHFTLRLLGPAPASLRDRSAARGAPGARGAAPPAAVVDPTAEARLRRARQQRLGAGAAGSGEAADPADERAAANIGRALAASRSADLAAAARRFFGTELALLDRIDVVMARQMEATVVPGVAREAEMARRCARAAMKREATRRGLPMGGAAGGNGGPRADEVGPFAQPAPTAPTTCTLCGSRVFCTVDLCSASYGVEREVARGVLPPARAPWLNADVDVAMDWGILPPARRLPGLELAVSNFDAALDAQDRGLGLAKTLAEARAVTSALLRAADSQ